MEMKVDGLNGLAPLRQPPAARDLTSSSPAGGAGILPDNGANTIPAPLPSSPSDAAVPAGYGLAGHLSLQMHFALAQSYSSTVSQKGADGYRELRSTVEKRFQADYSFDMTFMAQLDAAAQKMGGLGGDTLNQFVEAAGKLNSLGEDDLKNFINSADKLFGEFKKALGDNAGLDGARDLLKNSITDFIHMVKGEVDGTSSIAAQGGPGAPPLPQGQGAQPEAAQPSAPGAGNIDFQKLYDAATRKFDDALSSMLEKMMADAQKTMADFQQSFLDEMKKRDNGPDKSGQPDAPAANNAA